MTSRPRKYGSELPYKVIDRPRTGGHGYKKGRPLRDPDMLPDKEGMRKPYGFNRKEFSDHLGPLWGFLDKNCGKPWNKVHSKICQMIPGNTIQGKHIRDHVTFAVFMGYDHEYGRYKYSWKYARWYVDKKGFLRKNTKKIKFNSYKPPENTTIRIDDWSGYEKVKGIWHAYKREIRKAVYSVPGGKTERVDVPVMLYTRLSERKLVELKLRNSP